MSAPSRYAARARIVPAKDVAVLREAESYLAEARRIRDAAAAEADVLRAEVRERAAAEGAADAARAAAEVLARAEATAEERLIALEDDVRGLIAETVARIVGEIDRDEAIRLATAQSLAKLRQHRSGTLHVATDIAEPVLQVVAAIARQNGMDPMRVETDPRFEPGRCVFASEKGYVEIGLPALLGAALKPFGGRSDGI